LKRPKVKTRFLNQLKTHPNWFILLGASTLLVTNSSSLQEDVDVVGVSSLSDAHCRLAPRLVQRMKERGMEDVPVILGGLILDEDIPALMEAGIAKIFKQNAKLDDMVSCSHSWP
jgi:methylmalonyl-CoA mutase cobalamin-binding domain/chain